MCNTENLDENKEAANLQPHGFESLPGWAEVKPGGLFIVVRPSWTCPENRCIALTSTYPGDLYQFQGRTVFAPADQLHLHYDVYVKPEAPAVPRVSLAQFAVSHVTVPVIDLSNLLENLLHYQDGRYICAACIATADTVEGMIHKSGPCAVAQAALAAAVDNRTRRMERPHNGKRTVKKWLKIGETYDIVLPSTEVTRLRSLDGKTVRVTLIKTSNDNLTGVHASWEDHTDMNFWPGDIGIYEERDAPGAPEPGTCWFIMQPASENGPDAAHRAVCGLDVAVRPYAFKRDVPEKKPAYDELAAQYAADSEE